jgi:hypothetical protein
VAYSTPIDFVAIQNALVAWLREATDLPVVWADQNRPQTGRPFLVIEKIAGPTIIGRDEQRRRTKTILGVPTLFTDVIGQRALTYNVQAFSSSDAPGADAEHYLSLAQARFALDETVDAFTAAKLAVSDPGPVRNLNSIAGAGYVSRAAFDLQATTVSALVAADDQPTNWIETVELTNVSEG